MNLSLFPILAIALIVAISGCTQQFPGTGESVQPDGTIIKPDGTMVKPNGVMIKPDGTMLPPEGSPEGTTVSEDGTIVKPDGTMVKPDGTMIGPGGEVTPPPEPPQQSAGYTGQLLAGSTTPYIRYNEADFQKARSEGKAIYLYFRANWCPICNADRPGILAAFNEMNYDDVVGFEVHYADDETQDFDREITQQYQVPYQHTTVILNKDGSLLTKKTQSLNKDQIIAEVAAARAG